MNSPTDIQIIGTEIAILWKNGEEDYFPMEYLREWSPSAENMGEMDIFGNVYGGDGPKKFPGVEIVGWEKMGNYAIRFEFSDGHGTGLYTYDYLEKLRKRFNDDNTNS